jgi:thiamine-monophosphate kinase
MTERELLRWLRGRDPRLGERLRNDGAVLRGTGDLAVTVDHQIEGTHFLPGLDPATVARRLLAVNLSDLAAMGAVPRYVLLALAAPPEYPFQRFFTGLLHACRHFQVELAGGDLARCDRLHASLTACGAPPSGGTFLERSTARPGDRLWVGGTIGMAAAGLRLLRQGARLQDGTVQLPDPWPRRGAVAATARRAVLRHLEPRPQLALGQWLARQPRAAVLDLSDGLAVDLLRLGEESEVGAHLDGERLPAGEGFHALCTAAGWNPVALQMEGGEDYVLLFALPPESEVPHSLGCTAVGEVTASKEVCWRVEGEPRPWPTAGWDHLAASNEG